MTLVETTPVELDGQNVDIGGIRRIAEEQAPCVIAPTALEKAAASRAMFQDIVEQGIPVYGITTGYGDLAYMMVDNAVEIELQLNLVRSHCAGVGPLFAEDEARAMVAARLNALARGYSAVRPELLERLALLLNQGVTPAIPEIGSLGASGDLAPLSHIAAVIIGEGYVLRDGRPTPTGPVLRQLGVEPLQLRFKEGLSLINGTSAMTGLGALLTGRALTQVRQAEIVTALALEALQGSTGAFMAEGHELARPHRGQVDNAANMRTLLAGSGLALEHREIRRQVEEQKQAGVTVQRGEIYLQKPYTLRAIPQVVGAVRDTVYHATSVVTTELNSSNDNPLFFEGREVFHGANFHGQPVAFAMDFLTIALTQLGVTSERRTNRLLNRHLNGGLPEYLVAGEPGLNSGFTGAQYPATALVAENRTIGPASTQSIPSNSDNQDVVSMGLISARNARRVLRNNDLILAVEYLSAAQAVDLRGVVDRLGPAGRATYDRIRSMVPTLDRDRYMSDDIETVAAALARGEFVDALPDGGEGLR
ncbi:tyrosine 2,3-aminomutase [Micromonospora echinofusca]|uniref:Histidine ammonia-lyase n=1 Tax=Micromonospora echinofusca TaxID=47858 RepID=A0A1C5GIU2_MICEH|nr:tyrosine 2,3-aminomutase [Micromonospora echinofusca]SCG19512.1 histidine ammonia-lyase [Micromonospora echinofusca]